MIAARLEAARAEFAAVDAQMRDIAATGELARARSQAEATLSAAAASRRVVMGPRPRLPAASEGTARPARPVGERPGVTPPTPTVVDSAGFRQQIAAAGGDMSKAGDALVARVEQELARGAQVAYVIGDRRVPIVAIDRGMLADAQGQRWGLMQLTSAGNRLEIRPPVESLPTTNLIELALRQQAMAREGWAPGVSRDELAGANDAVYGKPKGEPAAPTPAPQAPGTEQAATAGATPEEALLEQQIAQLPPGALHPEDQAELAKSAEAIAEAGTMRSAFETAASCLLGLIG